MLSNGSIAECNRCLPSNKIRSDSTARCPDSHRSLLCSSLHSIHKPRDVSVIAIRLKATAHTYPNLSAFLTAFRRLRVIAFACVSTRNLARWTAHIRTRYAIIAFGTMMTIFRAAYRRGRIIAARCTALYFSWVTAPTGLAYFSSYTAERIARSCRRSVSTASNEADYIHSNPHCILVGQ